MPDEAVAARPTAPRPLGELLSASMNMFVDGWPRFGAVLAVGVLPGALAMTALMAFHGYADKEAVKSAIMSRAWGPLASLLAVGGAAAALKALATLALILVVDGFDRNQDVALGEAYRRAAGLFGPFFLTMILVTLWVAGGTLLLIIPGVILAIRFSLAHVAVALEEVSGGAALDRSKELVVAHMGKVVGNCFVMAVITTLIAVILGVALNLGGAFFKDIPFMPDILKILTRFLGELVNAWYVAFYVLLFKDIAALHPRDAAGQSPA